MNGIPQTGGVTGAHRDNRFGGRSRRWWGVTFLAAAVAATSTMVPSLVSPPTPRDNRTAVSPTLASSRAVPAAPASTAPSAGTAPSVSTAPSAPAASDPSRPVPSPTPPQFQTVRIAATDPANEFFGVAATTCPTCASGSRVQYVGQGHALVVHVRDIRVPGRRTLTIVYESNGVRPLDVSVNGGTTISLDLPGKDSWTTPAEIRLPIDLPVGPTVIKLFHANLPAPDLDQIVIS